MRASVIFAAVSASLAIAGPFEKRKYITEIETYYQTVTVTEGSGPEATLVAGIKQRPEDAPVEAQSGAETKAPVPVVTVTKGAETQPEPTNPSVVTVVKSEPQPNPTTEAPTAKQPSADEPKSVAPSDDDFQGAGIYHHNLHRANHSVPEVTWNDRIAGYASNSAAECVFKHDMEQGDKDYGQNIAMWGVSSGAEDLGKTGAIKMAVTDMWYNGEINNFPENEYGNDNPNMDLFESWGHYTQLIWKDSTEVGCAVQFCPKGTMMSGLDSWYMVCNYHPAGNVQGLYGSNILKPLGQPTVIGSS